MYSCTARTCRARSRTRALRATAIPPPSRPTTTIPAGSASRAASRRRSCRNWRGAATRRNHVDIGVIGDRALLARTNLKHRRIGSGTVLQAMPVEIVGRKPGGVAGAQDLLAGIGDEHDLARQHVDEFILAGMPMAL